MLKANIQAQIDQKFQQLKQKDKEIFDTTVKIIGMGTDLETMKREREDLLYDIRNLQEELEDE